MTRFGSLITLAASLLFAGNAAAAAADGAAQAKIDEAINVHYLDTNFAKAEKTLAAAISGCASKCSPTVVGRAWMYIGIIRAVGNQDMGGASDAFASAVEADPNVKLDGDLATPETKKLFEAAKADGGGSSSGVEETGEDPNASVSISGSGASSGTMECSPAVSEVETRRPIPVACTADENVKHAVLHYKAPGSSKYVQINLGLSDGQWMGTIPCSSTPSSGTLSWFVLGSGSAGQSVDTFGSKDEPTQISVVESSAEAPPSYPDKDPPNRCMDVADCPEEMRGTPSCPGTTKAGAGGSGGWGASCKQQSECAAELACINGTCETPSACETDAECNGGVCQNAICAYSDDGSSGGSGKAPKNLLGIHFGMDFALLSGAGICDRAVNKDFACYLQDGSAQLPYRLGTGPEMRSAKLNSTLAPATVRLLASFEHMFTNEIGGELRAGLAFGGAPKSTLVNLLHIEVRGKYWFSGTGKGLRPYLTVGGGIGQVDVAAAITVREDPTGGGTGYEEVPGLGSFCVDPSTGMPRQPYCQMNVKAYRKFGTSFVGGGAGTLLNLGPVGINAEILARVTLPSSTLVLTPTLGLVLGL